jgi:hypothetical protein
MNNATTLPPASCGKRLIPTPIDKLATTDAARVFVSIPRTAHIEDGFDDITFEKSSRAVNRCVWWTERTLQGSETFETLNYVGPQDVRYVILLFAAIKTGYKVRFKSRLLFFAYFVALLQLAVQQRRRAHSAPRCFAMQQDLGP